MIYIAGHPVLVLCDSKKSYDMTVKEAHSYAAKALREAFDVDLPEESNENWLIYEMFSVGLDLETNSYPPEKAEWHFVYIDRITNKMVYDILFDRKGENIITDKQDADDARVISSISTPYPKEQEAIEKYG